MSTKLIDISYWQGNLDFNKLKSAGIILFYVLVMAQQKTLNLTSMQKRVRPLVLKLSVHIGLHMH